MRSLCQDVRHADTVVRKGYPHLRVVDVALTGAPPEPVVGAEAAMRALDSAMRGDAPNVVVLSGASGGCRGAHAGRGGADVDVWVAEQVVAAVGTELGLPHGDVDPRVPLVETGVDSIMTVSLRRELEKLIRPGMSGGSVI